MKKFKNELFILNYDTDNLLNKFKNYFFITASYIPYKTYENRMTSTKR